MQAKEDISKLSKTSALSITMVAVIMIVVLFKWVGGAYLIYLGVMMWRSNLQSVRTSAITLLHVQLSRYFCQ